MGKTRITETFNCIKRYDCPYFNFSSPVFYRLVSLYFFVQGDTCRQMADFFSLQPLPCNFDFDFLIAWYGQGESKWRLQSSYCIFTSFIKTLTIHPTVFWEVTLRKCQDKYRIHTAIWDALEGVNQVSLSTFMHLLYLDFVSKVYPASFSLALTLRSNLLPADLCCLSNPAQCSKHITQLAQIEISY